MQTTETRYLLNYRLLCPHCHYQQSFKWPQELVDRIPEFLVCHRCQGSISVKFDSIPEEPKTQTADEESLRRVKTKLMANVLATPQNPAVTDVKPARPELTVQVWEGPRIVNEVPLDMLLSLIREFGKRSGWLAKYGDDEANAEYRGAKEMLYAALGVKAP